MASFQLFFAPRDISANESQIRPHIEDFKTLQARLLGRADDLAGSFDASATHFSDLIAWDISTLGAEDYQLWVDATVALEYAADVTEQWADYVKEFWDKRDDLWDEWDGAVASAVGRVPAEYAEATITASYPEREGFFESIGGSDANTCRDLYDELKGKLDDINQRAQDNYDKYEEHAEEIREMLDEGATDVNVQKLADGGYSAWSYSNLDPDKYLELESDFELTPDTARTTAEELASYWSGDKPLDARYHELMLVMSMIGTNARNAQNDGTKIDDEEIEFLEQFYVNVELQGGGVYGGVLTVPEWLEGDHMSEEDRERALGVLGDGLLALSDPELGGGYESLPESVRRAVEGPFLGEESGDDPPYPMSTYQEDAQALSALLEHTDDELQGGYTLSTNLTMSAGSYNYFWGGESENGWLTSEELAPLVDVGTRNEDANYYVLTGDHPESASDVDLNYPDSFREQAVQGLLTYEWHDQGETAASLIDWIPENSQSDDSDVKDKAGEAASGFIEMITTAGMQEALTNTGVDVTEGDEEYKNASFTAFNTELADDLVDIFDSYIYSFAASDVLDPSVEGSVALTGVGEYKPGSNGFNIGPAERAAYMQYLLGNSETAEHVVGSISAYQSLEMGDYVETGRNSSARGSASLFSLLEVALDSESENRKQDLQDTVDLKEKLYSFGIDKVEEYSDRVPVVGKSISAALGYGSDWIVDQMVEQDVSTSPRLAMSSGEDRNRETELIFLERVVNSQSESIDRHPPQEQINVLVDNGVAERQPDGSYVFELDKTKWNVTSELDGGMSDIDDAIKWAFSGSKISPTEEEDPESAYEIYNRYWDTYENRYEEIQNHAKR